MLGVRAGAAGPEPVFVIADSELDRTAVTADYPAAAAAALNGNLASAVEGIGGERIGETAIALGDRGAPDWVAVFSTDLADVDDNVALIRRQILIAGRSRSRSRRSARATWWPGRTRGGCGGSRQRPRRSPTATSPPRSRSTPTTRSVSSR